MFFSFYLTKLDTINTTFDSYEIKNITSAGYDIYVYGARSPQGVNRVQFPTWTEYGGQDDLYSDWGTNTKVSGTNIGNGTWKYHVNIANHNNEAGKYTTHVYIYGNNDTKIGFSTGITFIETDNYVGSLYLSTADSLFNNDKSYNLSSNILNTNFTYEFDAQPTIETQLYSNGTSAEWYNSSKVFNLIIDEFHGGTSNVAGIGLAIGTNGAVAIAHAEGYYYVLLSYEGDLSIQHKYRFTIKNNIPYLYIDDNLVAIGIEPLGPITILATNGKIGTGIYGSYKGYANNFVLYNSAR